MNFVDHIFIVMLFLVQPIYGYFTHTRLLQRTRSGELTDRVRLYKETMAVEWLALAALAAAWLMLDRSAADLGFVTSAPTQIWIGSAVLCVVTVFLVYAWYSASRMSAEQKADQLKTVGDMIYLLPHSGRDYRYFVAMSITAGVVEEVLYRAFTFWYLAHFMPIWAVVGISSVAFGLGHSYQGVGGMVKVALVGVCFGLLYVFTGSIWLPILAHAVFDIAQGASILEITRGRDQLSGPNPSGDRMAES